MELEMDEHNEDDEGENGEIKTNKKNIVNKKNENSHVKKLKSWSSSPVLELIEYIEQNSLEKPAMQKKVPKDYLKENIKMLRKLQIKNKEEKEKQSQILKPRNLFTHVKPKVYESHSCHKTGTDSQCSRRRLRCYSDSEAVCPKPVTPHPLGYKPPYIAKEKQKQEEKRQLEEEENKKIPVPDGHILLSQDERLLTLNLLHKHHDELTLAFQKLPIVCDTYGSQKRKELFERRLAKIEEGLEIFSKPVVFIRVGI